MGWTQEEQERAREDRQGVRASACAAWMKRRRRIVRASLAAANFPYNCRSACESKPMQRSSGGRPCQQATVQEATPCSPPGHECGQEARRPSLAPLVRRQGHARVRSPLAHGADGLARAGLRGQAGHRDRQYVERHQPLPRAFPRARRGSEARRAGRRAAFRSRCRQSRWPSRS